MPIQRNIMDYEQIKVLDEYGLHIPSYSHVWWIWAHVRRLHAGNGVISWLRIQKFWLSMIVIQSNIADHHQVKV